MKRETIKITPEQQEKFKDAMETAKEIAKKMSELFEIIFEMIREFSRILRESLEPVFRLIAYRKIRTWHLPSSVAWCLARKMPISWSYRLGEKYISQLHFT
jgi:hypothetical protein